MTPTYNIPQSAGAPHSVPPAASGRRATLIGVSIAAAVSLVAIVGAAAFTRDAAPPEAPPRGITIASGKVQLDADSPQWASLKLVSAVPSAPRPAGAVPARVTLDETRTWRIGAPLPGRVTRVYAELGTAVAAGTPLLAVSSPEVAGLAAERAKARLDLDTARKNLERIKGMVALRALPAKDEIQATQDEAAARLALDAADAKWAALSVAAGSSTEYTIAAPHAGIVVEKNVGPAQQVGPDGGTPLLVVADTSSVWVVADLFEVNASDIRPGSEAVVTFPSMPGTEVQARVDMVSAAFDPVRRALPVRLRLDNADHALRPNMYAEVSPVLQPPVGACDVPATAIVSDGENQYVYVQERQGEFTRRKVSVGAMRAGAIPVLAGLKAGEVVVERGAILLDNQIVLNP